MNAREMVPAAENIQPQSRRVPIRIHLPPRFGLFNARMHGQTCL
jgi:hypothetical protein